MLFCGGHLAMEGVAGRHKHCRRDASDLVRRPFLHSARAVIQDLGSMKNESDVCGDESAVVAEEVGLARRWGSW
jgi:hypothetical protein